MKLMAPAMLCLTVLLAAIATGDEDKALQKNEWRNALRLMSGDEFLQVTEGRCPIIWKINPNDPGYDTIVREKAASGVLIGINTEDAEGSSRHMDMEGGNIEDWTRYYRGTDTETMGWGVVEPPVRVPLENFPIRYESRVTDEQLDGIADDGLLVYVFGMLVFRNENTLAPAVKCREKFGNKLVVMRRLEATNGLWSYIRDRVRKAGLDPEKLTREQCFQFAGEWAKGYAGSYPPGFGFGASNVRLLQVIDIVGMDCYAMELANGCRQIDLAFCRGAKQQYDIPFLAFIAGHNTNKDGLWGRTHAANTPYERYYRFAVSSEGKPPHLLNRTFWVAWFHDADSLVGESTAYWCFTKGKDENHFDLSPLGEDLKKLRRFADTDFFDRGKPYTPACILLDYCHGWEPTVSPDAHGWDPPGFLRRKIWGVMDFKKRDIMIENFFGAVYPGHELASSWGNTYGDLVNTPYGDSFDVMLSNASEDALKKYKVVFTVGEPEMTEELFGKLSEYVKSGGDLVLNATDLTDQWKELMGIKMTRQENRWYKGPGMLRVSDSSQWLNEEPVKERRYFYYIIEGLPKNAEALAKNPERDHPIIVKIPVGKGNVYFTAVQNMQEGSGIYRPYGMTECCAKLVEYALEPCQKVFVEGEPIEYIVREQGDRLLVMVVNNRNESWKGRLRLVPPEKQAGYKLNEWYVESKPVAVAHEMVDNGTQFEDEIEGNGLRLYTLE